MKAVVYTQNGPPDVLQLMEVAKPEAKEDQVLVKVYAACANALDYRRFEKLSTMGRLMEEQIIKSVGKAPGADIAGRVEAVGASVKQFQPGWEVHPFRLGRQGDLVGLRLRPNSAPADYSQATGLFRGIRS